MSNRFDQQAASWDGESRRVKLAADVAAAILARVPLQPSWEALDFGCGTGLVTLALQPHLKHITGADASPGMLAELQSKIAGQGLSNVTTVQVDPTAPLTMEDRFHLITSSMTLHHIEHLTPLLQSFKAHLHPGGWIALADLREEDGSFHEDMAGVFHRGFAPEAVEGFLKEAGFIHVAVTAAAEVAKSGRTYPILLATAVAGPPPVQD